MKSSNKYLKLLFILLGFLSLTLGIIGIVIPGLPTTPLLLLSAFLFSRSSSKLYSLLLKSRLGRRIDNYTRKGGMTKKDKIRSLIIMWTMITISTTFLIPNITAKITVLALGAIGTGVIIFVVKNID
ncbi:MAG: DUF454 family protein [Rikenellaceae bacterium]